MSKSEEYIVSKTGYIRSLFEESYGKSVGELTRNWKEYVSFGLSDVCKAKLVLAYHLAQDCKEDLDFYCMLCFYYCLTVEDYLSEVKLRIYNEAITYCKDEELIHDMRYCIECCKNESANSSLEGFADGAAERVEGMNLYDIKIGRKSSLHDAYICEMHYNRERNLLRIVICTYSNHVEGDFDMQLVTIEFSSILRIETDIDYENDYAWTSRCYIDNTYLVYELESAHFKVMCENMKIVSIENVKRQILP